MISIFKKEVSAYFSTPFGFIFMGIFLLLSGIVFTTYNLLGGGGDLNGMFGLLSNMSFMVFPVLTIKLFADERRAGTEQLLLTSQLSPAQIVLGKYLAACFVFLVTLLVTGVYVVILKAYGYPDLLAIAGSYVGFFLLGIAFIAVCTLTSSLAENYLTAAILSFGALVGLTMIGALARTVNVAILTPALSALVITKQYDEFVRGVFRLGPIIYFIGFSVVSLYLAIISVGKRRYG